MIKYHNIQRDMFLVPNRLDLVPNRTRRPGFRTASLPSSAGKPRELRVTAGARTGGGSRRTGRTSRASSDNASTSVGPSSATSARRTYPATTPLETAKARAIRWWGRRRPQETSRHRRSPTFPPSQRTSGVYLARSSARPMRASFHHRQACRVTWPGFGSGSTLCWPSKSYRLSRSRLDGLGSRSDERRERWNPERPIRTGTRIFHFRFRDVSATLGLTAPGIAAAV